MFEKSKVSLLNKFFLKCYNVLPSSRLLIKFTAFYRKFYTFQKEIIWKLYSAEKVCHTFIKEADGYKIKDFALNCYLWLFYFESVGSQTVGFKRKL